MADYIDSSNFESIKAAGGKYEYNGVKYKKDNEEKELKFDESLFGTIFLGGEVQSLETKDDSLIMAFLADEGERYFVKAKDLNGDGIIEEGEISIRTTIVNENGKSTTTRHYFGEDNEGNKIPEGTDYYEEGKFNNEGKWIASVKITIKDGKTTKEYLKEDGSLDYTEEGTTDSKGKFTLEAKVTQTKDDKGNTIYNKEYTKDYKDYPKGASFYSEQGHYDDKGNWCIDTKTTTQDGTTTREYLGKNADGETIPSGKRYLEEGHFDDSGKWIADAKMTLDSENFGTREYKDEDDKTVKETGYFKDGKWEKGDEKNSSATTAARAHFGEDSDAYKAALKDGVTFKYTDKAIQDDTVPITHRRFIYGYMGSDGHFYDLDGKKVE